MRARFGVLPALTLIGAWFNSSLAAAQSVQQLQGGGDAEIVKYLQGSGSRIEGRYTVLFCDPKILNPQQAGHCSKLLDNAVADLRSLLRSRFGIERKIEFPIQVFVPGNPVISHVTDDDPTRPRVFMNSRMIAGRVDPYIHELVHALSGVQNQTQWLLEGWANYVASLVRKRDGAYDNPLFFNWGNKWVGGWVKNLLLRHENRERLDTVFASDWRLESLPSDSARLEFRAFAYAAAHSFTKYLDEVAGSRKLGAIYSQKETDAAVLATTGKSIDALKREWLQYLERQPQLPRLHPHEIDAFTGVFEGPSPLVSLAVMKSGDRLECQLKGEAKQLLVFDGKNHFRTRLGLVDIWFSGLKEGRMSRIKYRNLDGAEAIGRRVDDASAR